MNTKPNDELLALWVEDELDAKAAAEVEAWAAEQPEWLEKREQARWSRGLLGTALTPADDVPHAEFFNARIHREIGKSEAPSRFNGWRSWALPLTAAAGLALGFFLGQDGEPEGEAPLSAEWAPVLYTPEQGVEAELVGGDDATVIVLAGVNAISDDWEIPETAMLPPESSRMARRDEEREDAIR